MFLTSKTHFSKTLKTLSRIQTLSIKNTLHRSSTNLQTYPFLYVQKPFLIPSKPTFKLLTHTQKASFSTGGFYSFSEQSSHNRLIPEL